MFISLFLPKDNTKCLIFKMFPNKIIDSLQTVVFRLTKKTKCFLSFLHTSGFRNESTHFVSYRDRTPEIRHSTSGRQGDRVLPITTKQKQNDFNAIYIPVRKNFIKLIKTTNLVMISFSFPFLLKNSIHSIST